MEYLIVCYRKRDDHLRSRPSSIKLKIAGNLSRTFVYNVDRGNQRAEATPPTSEVSPPAPRKEGVAMSTYSDLIQTSIHLRPCESCIRFSGTKKIAPLFPVVSWLTSYKVSNSLLRGSHSFCFHFMFFNITHQKLFTTSKFFCPFYSLQRGSSNRSSSPFNRSQQHHGELFHFYSSYLPSHMKLLYLNPRKQYIF